MRTGFDFLLVSLIVLLILFLSYLRKEPNEPASLKQLAELGVLYWRLDADKHETDPKLAAIRKVRGYSYMVRTWLQCIGKMPQPT